jgi:type III secretion system HrpB4-like protein
MGATQRGPDAQPLPVVRMAMLLQAYQARLRRLGDDVDPGRLAELVPPAPALTPLQRSAQLRHRLRLGPVAPDAFTPPAHRLAVLDKSTLLAVLAARALYAHRAALARCVDGALLATLRALVGAPALAVLRAAGAEAAPWRGAMPLPACATPLDWAIDGYARFERDGAWQDATLRRLIEVTLPAGPAPDVGPAGPGDDSAVLVALLPTLFPELTWLFG